LDIASVCDFHHVGAQRVRAVSGYDDGRLWLVLRSGRAASGPSVSAAALTLRSTTSSDERTQFFSVEGGGVAVIFIELISFERSGSYASLAALLLVFRILMVVLVEMVLELMVVKKLKISGVKRGR
jgi:hypothetical protein